MGHTDTSQGQEAVVGSPFSYFRKSGSVINPRLVCDHCKETSPDMPTSDCQRTYCQQLQIRGKNPNKKINQINKQNENNSHPWKTNLKQVYFSTALMSRKPGLHRRQWKSSSLLSYTANPFKIKCEMLGSNGWQLIYRKKKNAYIWNDLPESVNPLQAYG